MRATEATELRWGGASMAHVERRGPDALPAFPFGAPFGSFTNLLLEAGTLLLNVGASADTLGLHVSDRRRRAWRARSLRALGPAIEGTKSEGWH